MHFLVYVSSATDLFSRSDLFALLERAREKNAGLGITGMLLYRDGNFMQALEGEEAAVEALHQTIAADPRHRGMITLLRGTHPERQFPKWSMAFRDLADDEARSATGFSEFLNTPLTPGEFSADPSRAQRLMSSFKRTMLATSGG